MVIVSVDCIIGLIVTVVKQLVVVHPFVTVHVIVETPGLNIPLALMPDPEALVAPVIVQVIVNGALQLSEAEMVGIVYVFPWDSQNV